MALHNRGLPERFETGFQLFEVTVLQLQPGGSGSRSDYSPAGML